VKINKVLIHSAILSSIIMFSGCSAANPFGIGYDTSVCEDSKDFGVCGSPKEIYNNRDAIRKVQSDYLRAELNTVLFFAINKNSEIVVKEDRDGKWELYETSRWKTIIDNNISKISDKISDNDKKERKAGPVKYGGDIPITEDSDLSIKYKQQGPLLVSRTNIGDIIRDNGIIQQTFVANYADYTGDLISSHELYIVVKDPEWVVGEKAPKESSIQNIPTPISTELLKKQDRVNEYQERIIDRYNIDDQGAVVEAVNNDPTKIDQDQKNNMDLINSFIKKEKNK
jgi:hypothetical protein